MSEGEPGALGDAPNPVVGQQVKSQQPSISFSEMLKNQLISADSTQITDGNHHIPQFDLTDAKRVINGSAAISEKSIFLML